MQTATLAYRDGWLCAAEVSTRSMEPIQDTLYWPLKRERRDLWEEDLGKPLLVHRHSYSLKIGGFWKEFRLPEGGQTKAIAVESAPVPKPKGLRKTTQVRWYYGRWQKYSHKDGWVTA